ncbi:MAG: hypothetical protein MUF81_17120 [Verrucomicrobia bacterium]|nr:hypothetical protein [Verrucomicrobiota bacterium]
MKIITIGTTRTAAEADMKMSALRAAGFHPLDLPMFENFSLAGVEISYPIRISSSEAGAARELLVSLASSQKQS